MRISRERAFWFQETHKKVPDFEKIKNHSWTRFSAVYVLPVFPSALAHHLLLDAAHSYF